MYRIVPVLMGLLSMEKRGSVTMSRIDPASDLMSFQISLNSIFVKIGNRSQIRN